MFQYDVADFVNVSFPMAGEPYAAGSSNVETQRWDEPASGGTAVVVS